MLHEHCGSTTTIIHPYILVFLSDSVLRGATMDVGSEVHLVVNTNIRDQAIVNARLLGRMLGGLVKGD